MQKSSATFPRAWMQQEKCNRKNCFTSGSKKQAWIFSSPMTTINCHQTVREVFPTTWPMAYTDNTCWWCLMSLQNFLSNICRLIRMKVSGHSPGGRGEKKTAIPGKLSKTEAFCVTRLLMFLEREANAIFSEQQAELRLVWHQRKPTWITLWEPLTADNPSSQSVRHPVQTCLNHPLRATDCRQPLLAVGVWLVAFQHVSTYILTLNAPIWSSVLPPRTK